MKILTYLMLLLVTGGCTFAQPEITGAKWNLTLNVVDENNQPVPDAQVSVGYTRKRKLGESEAEYRLNPAQLEGKTDTNGVFSASHTDTSWDIRIDVKKAGYYSSTIIHQLFMPGQVGESKVEASRNATLTVVLKKIVMPISMYAKSVNLGLPVFDKPAGFDLEIGDWVEPYGKGITADLIFTAHNEKRSEFDWDYKLVVSFSNAGDGIQEFTVPESEKGSGLRSAYDAPADNYVSQWVQTMACRPHRGGYSGNRDDNRNYYFRVRTKIDDRGNIVSAHYGKIYGDFMQFKYYLNPTINDRNVEFDPKQNLIKNLKPLEQVKEP